MSTNEELVRGVDFLPVPTRDIERAVEFYGNTLGLRRSVYMPERNFAEFETGNLTLSIIHAEKMGLEHHVSGNAIALHVDDVEATRKKLEAQGVSLQRRHARHERVPHGLLQRPRRQRADAPPPLRPAGHRGLGRDAAADPRYPGARELLAIHERELPQSDDLCGAFCGALALAAAGIDARDGEPLDQDAVALAAGSVVCERPRRRSPAVKRAAATIAWRSP